MENPEVDEAAAKRAAAEARRQKILARGKDRLAKITVGTPMEGGEAAEAPQAQETSAQEAPVAAAPSEPGPTAAPEAKQGQPQSAAAETFDSQVVQATLDKVTASLSNQDAEKALHQLLNHLAFGDTAPSLQQQDQVRPVPSDAVAGSRSTPLGMSPSASRGVMPGFEDLLGPSGPAGPAAGPSAPAFTVPFLGPKLSAAIQKTRLARCLAAIILAFCLINSYIDPRDLQMPPAIFLLFSQVCFQATKKWPSV